MRMTDALSSGGGFQIVRWRQEGCGWLLKTRLLVALIGPWGTRLSSGPQTLRSKWCCRSPRKLMAETSQLLWDTPHANHSQQTPTTWVLAAEPQASSWTASTTFPGWGLSQKGLVWRSDSPKAGFRLFSADRMFQDEGQTDLTPPVPIHYKLEFGTISIDALYYRRCILLLLAGK